MSGILRIFKMHEYSIYIKCGNSVFIFQEIFCAEMQGKKRLFMKFSIANPGITLGNHLFYSRFHQFIEMTKKIKESFRCK